MPPRVAKRKAAAVEEPETEQPQQETKADKTTKYPRRGLAKRTEVTPKPTKAKATTAAASKKTAAAAAPKGRKTAASAKGKAKAVEEEEEKPAKKATAKKAKTTKNNSQESASAASSQSMAVDAEDSQSKKPSAKRARVSPPSPTSDEKTSKATVSKAAPAPPVKKARRALPIINERPQTPCNVYVFGKGEMGELGLGPAANAIKVMRPRLNAHLDREKVGIVQIACGGMHTLALAKDGTVYSWGVNDNGALGRTTTWQAPERDADASDSEDDDEPAVNPLESTPKPVEGFPEGVNITKVAAGDSISLAVTDEGLVYAWGTFRCNEGQLGFSKEIGVARRPVLLKDLSNVVDIQAGTDHCLALTKDGRIWAWGNGQQFQLGHRVFERNRIESTRPRQVGLRNARLIGAGSYHSFAVTNDGKVYSWGLNQYAQTGHYHFQDGTDAGGSICERPTHMESLDGINITQITGGEHHSAALSADGDLYMWGRMDSNALGLDKSKVPVDDELIVKDVAGKDRFLVAPTRISDTKFAWIGCGTHHNVALARDDGAAWSWGFADSYQVGLGNIDDDVLVPTKIENTATRGVRMTWSGAGGQFSVLMGNVDEELKAKADAAAAAAAAAAK